jgi:hypothetical protein
MMRAMDREDLFQQEADRRGWQFSIDDDEGVVDLPFRFFTNGVGRSVSNLLMGTYGDEDVMAFDFEWNSIVGGTFQATTTTTSTCAVAAVAIDAPSLMVSHESLWDRIAHPSRHEVWKADDEAFERRFKITTPEPDFAAALFTEEVRAWFVEAIADTDVSFELAGPWILAFTKELAPAEITPVLLDALLGFRSRVPDAVFEGWPAPDDETPAEAPPG